MSKFIISLFFGLILANHSYATSEPIILASVINVDGRVTTHTNGSPRGKRITDTPGAIKSQEFVRTYKNSKARIQLADKSKILLTENATLEFKDDLNLFVETGRVLFSINKREATRSLNILTKTAVIGVKGTEFLVESEGDNALIHLKEGEVEVKSLVEQFEDYKAEYEKFKKDYMQEYSDFKQNVSMKAGTTLSIGLKGLKEIPTPSHIEALFAELDAF